MGGKVWSEEEERVFWTEIVPTSSKRLLHDRPNGRDAKGWEDLCQVMQTTMGDGARRQYTALMLYEHFFQNTVLKRYSPNAIRYARAYQARHMAGRAARAMQGRRMSLGAPTGTEEEGQGAEDPMVTATTTDATEEGGIGIGSSSASTSDPLQLAIDAFELLSRADRRHKRSEPQTAADSFASGSSGAAGAAGAAASLGSDASASFARPHLSASNSAPSLAAAPGGFYHHHRPGQLPVYPQFVVPSQLGLSSSSSSSSQQHQGTTDSGLPMSGFPSAGSSSSSYHGYSSGSTPGTPGSGMAMQQQHLTGSYFGYMPPVSQLPQMHTPANGFHQASGPQEAGAVAGQTTDPAGHPYQSTPQAEEEF